MQHKTLSFIYYASCPASLAIYPSTSDEQPYNVGIHDLTTHNVYCGQYRYFPGRLLPYLFTLTIRWRFFSVTLIRLTTSSR